MSDLNRKRDIIDCRAYNVFGGFRPGRKNDGHLGILGRDEAELKAKRMREPSELGNFPGFPFVCIELADEPQGETGRSTDGATPLTTTHAVAGGQSRNGG